MAGLVAVTTAMLRERMTSEECAVVTDDARLAEAIAQACDRVIAHVNSCSRNRRIPMGLSKVPAPAVIDTLAIARHAVLGSVPGMVGTLEGSTRQSEYQHAEATLMRIASCQLDMGDYADDPDLDGDGSNNTTLHGAPAQNWCIPV